MFKKGIYALYNTAKQMAYIAGQFTAGVMVATCDSSDFLFDGTHVLRRDTFRLVVPAGKVFRLTIKDKASGLALFQGDFSAITDPNIVTLVSPPAGDDKEPPGVLTASPSFVYRFLAPAPSALANVAHNAIAQSVSRSGGGVTVTVNGTFGAAPPRANIRLYNLSALSGKPGYAQSVQSTASLDGDFQIPITATEGDRLSLGIENTNARLETPIQLRFDKLMASPSDSYWQDKLSLRVRVQDAAHPCRSDLPFTVRATPPEPGVDTGNALELTVLPKNPLEEGCHYLLRVDTSAVDATPAKNAPTAAFEADFGFPKNDPIATQGVGFVRKVLYRGGLLLETGEDNRIHLYAAANPGNLTGATECASVPLPGVGRDMLVDKFGRLAVTGGGMPQGYGYVAMFDFAAGGTCGQTLAPRGTAVVSSLAGGDLLQYPPAGAPRRLSLYQPTKEYYWAVGRDIPPSLLTVTSTPGYRKPFTVSGDSTRGFLDDFRGHKRRFVTLTDLTTGESASGKTDATGGPFSVALGAVSSGDTIRVEVSYLSLAVVDALGYGLALVDLEAVYNPAGGDLDPTDPNLDSKLILAYTGTSGSPSFCTDDPAKRSCDVFQRCHGIDIGFNSAFCALFIESATELGLPVIHDLLALEGAAVDPRGHLGTDGKPDGTVDVFGALNGYGLVAFNVDLEKRERFPIQTAADPKALIRQNHVAGVLGSLPLKPAAQTSNARAVDVAFAAQMTPPDRPQYCTAIYWPNDGDALHPRFRPKDLAFVAASVNGVYVVDVTDPAKPAPLGRYETEGGALALSVDPRRKLLYVSDAGSGVKVFSVADPCGDTPSGQRNDDRLVTTLRFGPAGTGDAGVSNAPVSVDPDTGFAFAGANLTSGSAGTLDAYNLAAPPIYAVADTDLDGQFEVLTRVIPLGVRNPAKDAAIGDDPTNPKDDPSFSDEERLRHRHQPYTPESFRVLAFVPGGAGETITADVASTSSEGFDLPKAAPGLPPTSYKSLDALVLRRQSADPTRPEYNRYQSDPVVVIADPRAQLKYQRSDEEKTLPASKGKDNPNACQSCDVAKDIEASLLYEGTPGSSAAKRRELLTGERIRINLTDNLKGKLPYLNTQQVDLRGTGVLLDSVLRQAPSLIQRPVLSGNEVLGVATHSGEYTTSAVDLAVVGRGLSLAFDRTLATQNLFDGPLGRNWDSSLFERLGPQPNADVDYYPGDGRRFTFRYMKDKKKYDSPEGIASTLDKALDQKYYLKAPDGSLTVFDENGRKLEFWDRHVVTAHGTAGSRLRFVHDSAGRLVTVLDDLSRKHTLEYDDSGHLTSLTDFDNRKVELTYDDQGRLSRVKGPDPESGRSQRPQTSYSYSAGGSQDDLKKFLVKSLQLEQLADGNGATPYSVTYDTAKPGAAKSVQTIDGTTQLDIDTQAGTATVTDPLGYPTTFNHDTKGHVTSTKDPLGNGTEYVYVSGTGADDKPKDDGLLALATLPLQSSVVFQYDRANRERTRQFNLQIQTRYPKPGFLDAPLVTSISSYDSHNLPKTLVAPEGTTTIDRNDVGDPTAISLPGTGATSLSPDKYGRVGSLDETTGRHESRQYDDDGPNATGQLAQLSVSGGNTTGTSVSYTRDARGNVTQSVDSQGHGSSYQVNKLDQVENESRGGTNPSFTDYTYDAVGQVTQRNSFVSASAFSFGSYQYDPLGRLVSRSASDAGATTYGYDGQGNLNQVLDSLGHITFYGYDKRGLLTGVTDPEGGVSGFTYNANGARTASTNPRGGVTTYTLDGFDRTIGGTDPTGAATVAPVDTAGHVPETRVVAPEPTPGAGKPLYRWTVLQFDAAGRVTKEIRKLFEIPSPSPQTTDVVTETRYDVAGRVTDVIDPLGRITHTDYDGVGRVKLARDPAGNEVLSDYDTSGNRSRTTVRDRKPDGSFDEFVTGYAYDDQNRVVAVTAPGNRVTRTTYDRRGLVASQTDPDGGVTSYEYDLAGRKTKETDPIGAVTTWAYDISGNLKTLTDANNHTTAFAYDRASRLTTETRPDGKKWVHTYDPMGNRTTTTDPNGTVTTFTYDLAGRLTGRTIATGSNVGGTTSDSMTLDVLGRATAWASTGGSAPVNETARYDSLDRTLEETVQLGSGPLRSTQHAWDLAGNGTAMLYPSGRRFVFTPDALNRVKRIDQQLDPSTLLPVVSYEDTGSRQVKKTLGNGLVTTSTYDAAPFLKTLAAAAPSAPPLLSIDYSNRNKRGLKLDVVRADRGLRDHYEYDAAGRITKEELGFPEPPPPPPAVPTPDVRNAYALDRVLNILQRDRTQAGTTVTTNGTFNVRNELTQWGSQTPSYDPNGNLIAYGGVTFQYDADNHLIKATLPNGDSYQALYDSRGRKVQDTKTVSGITLALDIVQSGDRVLETYPAGGTVPTQVFVNARGTDEVVKAELDPTASGTTTTVYPISDELSNVTHLTDADGLVVERYTLESYGLARIFDAAGSPLTASAYGWNRIFQGRPSFSLFPAVDFRARTLFPELGRFSAEDPIKAHPNLSLYEALGGNWTGHTDPRGLDWTPQARRQQRELIADLGRFKASAGEGLRTILGAFSRNEGAIYNPADKLAASLPNVANLSYYFEEEVIEDYGTEWSNYVLSHLEDRLQSFSSAWDRAKPQNHDNVYFDEEAGHFALFDREAFETSYGMTGLVSTGFDVFAAAGATGEARGANAGYEVGPAPRLNANSLENPLDTHVYGIYGPDGLWKIGESSQGVRKRDGKSKRAEQQVRKLEKKTGQRFESFILKSFSGKAAGRAYETRLIQRYARRFGRPPGNPLDR